MTAGVRRPRVERKMAPLKLMNSSRSGKAAARATVEKTKRIILISKSAQKPNPSFKMLRITQYLAS